MSQRANGGKYRKPKAKAPKMAEKPLPVTLLSGFLGSGKTSLLKHILTNKEGMRVAIIMNEITEVNLDVAMLEGAKLLKSEEKLVEMANGCICCTLREDLLLQLRELARSGLYDAVLIESSGIAEPMQVAETFFVTPEDGNAELQREAPLDNCVTVIDASVVDKYMESLETVSTIDPKSADDPEGQQDIASLLFAQLEFANVVLLNKIDLIGSNAKERSEQEAKLNAIINKINHQCTIYSTEHGRIPLDKILRTGNFSVEFAEKVNNWMEDISSGIKHVPETLEYGVSGFYWASDKPFHPKRLHEWLDTNFLLKEVVLEVDIDEEDEEGEEGEEGSDAEAANPPQPEDDDEDPRKAEGFEEVTAEMRDQRRQRYGNLFRSKGFCWLAGAERQKHLCQWSQAGTIVSFEPTGLADFSQGPPGQRFTFVGQHLKQDVLKADLEKLLMTEEEMKTLEKEIEKGNLESLEDPFAPFPDAADVCAIDHDHDHHHHHHHVPKRAADGRDEADELPKKAKRNKK